MNEIQHIKTVEEILKAVNLDNLDNFIIDFKTFLKVRAEMKKIEEFLGTKIVKVETENTFMWIDDGKNDIGIKITVQ